ncbi:23S rRNA (uracil(1939)-C(5))-methyltransferase RlmD, partial [Butyrivibrio sp. WCE2006]|uniref:23S rRNA (uracil(1939)-C(5))-methyltransferase RlmD n=1 Tax=Butyrivibrio sp. WCE2006 TaxID=1410611 RepID=UPI0005D139AB
MANKSNGNFTYKKGDILTVRIEDIGNDGEGIGKVEGYTLFVKDAVIGDLVKVSIMKSKKNYAYAHLDEIIEASKYRVEPKCPVSRACGGCQIQNLDYKKQLEFKKNKVRNNLVRLGSFDAEFVDSIMEPIIGMEDSDLDNSKDNDVPAYFRYRNKAQFPIGTDKNGNPIAGFYAGRTHSIIPVEDCLLGVKENKEILDIVIDHMKKHNIKAYDEATGKGVFRHVLIRKGFTSGEIMVCFVINSQKGNKKQKGSEKRENDRKESYITGQQELIDRLLRINGIKSITVNINNEKTNVILGKEIHTLWGEDYITDTLCGIEFRISPLSFYQVNPVQTEKLYNTAINYANLTGNETVWDLYCGIGTISLSMARTAGHVYGVEVIPQAIENARENAANNNIDNATFFVGKAEEVLPAFYDGKLNAIGDGNPEINSSDEEKRKRALSPDVIVVDPPRKGCDINCLETMLKMHPEKIVYVSCDSATLARDLRILVDGGYELKNVTPCDLFPNTVHVETVVLLGDKRVDGHIEIDVDDEKLDNTGGRAT